MNTENMPSLPSQEQKESLPPIYTIDLSNGWDTSEQKRIFKKKIKILPFYHENLLYSGFNGDDIGISSGAAMENGERIFCGKEKQISCDENDFSQDALSHALHYDNPAIAVYDPQKLKHVYGEVYTMQGDKTALIGIIRLTF
jgi:hypothetical protein